MMKFKLPFNGIWYTGWGGDTKELNHHHDNEAQRYAFDFHIRKDNSAFINSGKKNSDYHCFDAEIISPADGEVVQVVDGVDDNEPGYLNGYWVAGNTVIIKHTEGLYSFLAHFKQNSIKVKVGDNVKTGQLIGLCGNSGNTDGPHLHFHIQDRANTLFAKGIKCYFENIKVAGNEDEFKTKKKYSPIKDEYVSN